MNFSNLKVKTRLAIGFGIVVIFMACIAAIGINAVRRSNDALHQIVEVNVQKMELAQSMSKNLSTVTRVMRTIALLSDDNQKATEREKIATARAAYDAALEKLKSMTQSDEGKILIERVETDATEGRKINNTFMSFSKADHDTAVAFLLKESIPAMAKWQATLDEIIELQDTHNKTDEQSASSTNQTAITFSIIFAAIALLASVAIGWFITVSLRKQLGGEPGEAAQIALQIAGGDLTAQVNLADKDQTSMMFAIKKMRDSLTGIVNDVRNGTETIASASTQISAGNLDLSSRTEQQAASLEETASSMEELTATVKQNADNSRQAHKLATNASEVAVKGGAVVAEVVNTMTAINDSAKKIVDIIGVIDGIAFQTNILALNAAVEAARAGEQGRGFAVVASEVRNLAQRSASAAKEIKGLITDSVEKVDAGSKLVNQAGATMGEVVSSVKLVNDIINEITAASSEQASGIDQINQAISQMDEVTQQNAALVEEAAAAAASLNDQAIHLTKLVQVFKTEADQSAEVSSDHDDAAMHKRHVTTPANKPNQIIKFNAAQRNQQKRGAASKTFTPKVVAAGSGSWEEF